MKAYWHINSGQYCNTEQSRTLPCLPFAGKNLAIKYILWLDPPFFGLNLKIQIKFSNFDRIIISVMLWYPAILAFFCCCCASAICCSRSVLGQYNSKWCGILTYSYFNNILCRSSISNEKNTIESHKYWPQCCKTSHSRTNATCFF
jgi:hypothetical protein